MIGRGEPKQNIYVKSFNDGLRNECLSEHRLTSLDHTKHVVETRRREY
jgi:putative transposase